LIPLIPSHERVHIFEGVLCGEVQKFEDSEVGENTRDTSAFETITGEVELVQDEVRKGIEGRQHRGQSGCRDCRIMKAQIAER
jgi:hypothetical protein